MGGGQVEEREKLRLGVWRSLEIMVVLPTHVI